MIELRVLRSAYMNKCIQAHDISVSMFMHNAKLQLLSLGGSYVYAVYHSNI